MLIFVVADLETIDVPMQFGCWFGTTRRAIDLNFIITTSDGLP